MTNRNNRQDGITDYLELHLENAESISIPIHGTKYLKGYGNYVKVVGEARTTLVRLTMNRLEQSLPGDQFIRIHKSYIVNKGYISDCTADYVFMDAVRLPIGKTYKQFVRRILAGVGTVPSEQLANSH
jgi:hypothetical protein